MVDVTVTPEEYTFVHFDAARIADLAAAICAELGMEPAQGVRIEVDETTPLGRARVESADPLAISVESGAFEDPRRPRHLSERRVTDVLGRLLVRLRDRLDPAFGDPPSDEDLTLAQSTAWDAYAMGRFERLGHPSQQARRRYHFRNRHGFTDVADAAFDRLWAAEALAWADLEAACAETAAALPAPAEAPAPPA